MNIIILHPHFEADHLEAVKAEMKVLGAPTIKAVWSDCYGAWVALEGCHRIRAAHALDLTPEIEEVEYSDEVTMHDMGLDCQDDYTIARIVDDAWQSEMVKFED